MLSNTSQCRLLSSTQQHDISHDLAALLILHIVQTGQSSWFVWRETNCKNVPWEALHCA